MAFAQLQQPQHICAGRQQTRLSHVDLDSMDRLFGEKGSQALILFRFGLNFFYRYSTCILVAVHPSVNKCSLKRHRMSVAFTVRLLRSRADKQGIRIADPETIMWRSTNRAVLSGYRSSLWYLALPRHLIVLARHFLFHCRPLPLLLDIHAEVWSQPVNVWESSSSRMTVVGLVTMQKATTVLRFRWGSSEVDGRENCKAKLWAYQGFRSYRRE